MEYRATPDEPDGALIFYYRKTYTNFYEIFRTG